MNLSNFIEEYKISDVMCDQFIQHHQKNKEDKGPGLIGTGEVVNKKIKDSIDVCFHNGSREPFILNFFQLLSKYVTEYHHKYNIPTVQTDPVHIIQYYKPGGGYPFLHYERSYIKPHRQLAYMLYLNTVKDKGGTKFPFQDLIISAIKGDLYISRYH